MNLLLVIPAGVLVALFAFSVRIGLLWPDRYRGCDAYYHLLCTEEFRKRKKVPIVLPPYYQLENQEQWYPPGFTIFLSIFPETFLKKYHWVLSPAVDCLILVFLYIMAYLKTENLWLAVLAGFLYAITPAVIGESSSLNPRHLSSLFLAVIMISLFEIINHDNLYWLGLFLPFGFLLLMTHKMTSQLFYFVLAAMSLVFWHPAYVLGMLAIVAITLILSGGFFVKVLRGHYDILSFWNQHWRNLGAHQIYSSPIYGQESRKDPFRFHQRGIKDLYRKTKMLGNNVFVLLLIFPILFYPQLPLFDKQMLWWVVFTYFLAALSLFVPQLRFLGEGSKYLKMVALPVSYLAIVPLHYSWGIALYYYIILAIGIAVSMVAVSRGYQSKWLQVRQGAPLHASLTRAINFLKTEGSNTVICIPNHLSDMVAYFCRNRVIWGTHNYPFSKAEPFMPVWQKPLEFFVHEYNVTHVLIDVSYASPEVLRLSPDNKVFTADCYEVYQIDYGKNTAISGSKSRMVE